MSRFLHFLFGILAFAHVGYAADSSGSLGVATLLQPNSSPLVTFRLLFLTGAANDPPGQEGLASLTAAMLAKGGTRTLAYEQIVEAMYPMATSFDWQVDKEMTVFTGTTHQDNLDRYYSLISQMLLEPGFREEDFTRLKSEAINFLKVSLREGNDEELGKEHLYNVIYRNHPYGHHNLGRLSALEKLTIEDVRSFYQRQYRQVNLIVGLAGGFPDAFARKISANLANLPAGKSEKAPLRAPGPDKGMKVEIIQRVTRSTGISLGFPISVRRGDPDWVPLALAASAFGEHRSQNGRLYQRLREARGLNYGDYAYLEYFPRGMFQFQPDPNLARQQQMFQIWIRPVEPQNAHFALRAALYEFDKLIRDGLSLEEFEATREYLGKHANVLLQTQDARLGYALDSRYYGTPPFGEYLRDQLARLTVDDVNRAIRRHLNSDNLRIVIVTREAVALREAILGGQTSPISYNSPKPSEILAEDKLIEKYPINLSAEAVKIVPVTSVFD
jgi:zinc protease